MTDDEVGAARRDRDDPGRGHQPRRAPRAGRLLLIAATSALLPMLCSCSAGGILVAALGQPPAPASSEGGKASEVEPVAETFVLPGVDTSAGWSPLTAGNADARAARSGFAVPPPARPTLPADPVPPDPPVAQVEPPVRTRFLGRGPVVPRIKLEPMASCPELNDNTWSVAVRVVPATAAVTTTFWFRGTASLTGLRVGAEPLSLRAAGTAAVVRVVLPKPSGCRELTATVPGLRSGDTYRVIVEEETSSTVTGRTTWRIVGRSEGFVAG